MTADVSCHFYHICWSLSRQGYGQVSATGQGAATTYRDAQGRKVDLEELQRQQQAEQAAKKPKAEPPEWGRGIAQVYLLLQPALWLGCTPVM